MRKFAKLQPKNGETVLHCGHPETPENHFFYAPGTHFNRPDGTSGEAAWMVLCAKCFLVHYDNPESVMRADGKWIGDEPEIKENLQ